MDFLHIASALYEISRQMGPLGRESVGKWVVRHLEWDSKMQSEWA
jgi:hypothetical protein